MECVPRDRRRIATAKGVGSMRFWSIVPAAILPLVSFAAPRTWTIGNGEIARTLTFSETSGLYTERLSDLRTHTDFIAPGALRMDMAQEFSFLCNGIRVKLKDKLD